MTNTSKEQLAFKVKTTAPKLYCVRPNASIVAPGESVKISIILQGFTQPLPKDYKCKDKFLIVSCPCPDLDDPSKVADNWNSLHLQYGLEGSQKKLRVNFIIEDDASNETQINDASFANATQHTPTRDTLYVNNADTTLGNEKSINGVSADKTLQDESFTATGASSSGDIQKELADSNTKINSLSEKLDSNEAAPRQGSSVIEPVSGISIPFAVFLVILALLLGWYIF